MVDHVAWLGHDSFRISGSKVVYIDPWHIAGGAPPADIVLVTHDHYDHFNKSDIAKISGPATVVVGPEEVTAQVRGETRSVAPGDIVTIGGVTIRAVPAYNTDKFREPGVVFHPQADAKVGYVIEMDGTTYYHAGDTDVIDEMSEIDVDVALLPVSGTYVMTADEAARACDKIRAKVVVPMHYGTIVGTVADAERLSALCPVPVTILAKSAP
jgi:L-ascorbate metabolism protein UlaG (beta-lactamase superfamily)